MRLFVALLSTLLSPILVFLCLEALSRYGVSENYWSRRPHDQRESEFEREKNQQFLLRSKFEHLQKSDYTQPEFERKDAQKAYGYLYENTSGYIYHRPNSKYRHVSKTRQDSSIIYDVEYNFDEFGRRRVPKLSSNPFLSHRHLIVSGCSNVFGEGLNDEETLAAQIQKNYPGTLYNLARSGGSIVDGIAIMQTTSAFDKIVPPNGNLLVHFSIYTHVERFLGTVMSTGRWNQRGAFVEEIPKGSGQFYFKGLYENQKPVRTIISKMLSKSHFLNSIEFDWPQINDEVLDNYARAILFLKKKYQEKTHINNNLIVYLHPGEEASRRIIPFLEKYKIYYLDYSVLKLKDYAKEDLKISYDGHPSREYNRLLGLQIAHDLTLAENKMVLLNQTEQ